MVNQTIFVSATPGDFELEKTEGVVVEQVVRPTGLLDPPIEVRPSTYRMTVLILLISVSMLIASLANCCVGLRFSKIAKMKNMSVDIVKVIILFDQIY